MIYTSITVERKENYAIVQLDGGKVNEINTAMVRDLKHVFTVLDQDDSVRGIILSGRPHGFSAGLDIVNIAMGGKVKAEEFWNYYHEALQAMIRFSKPFVCAITGYAPAGATILALCADYRVMGKGTKHVVGMHEFKLSMQVPELLSNIYAYYLGEKQAWEAVQQMKLYTSDQALEVGLVNESVEVESVLERSELYLQKMLNIHTPVFTETKRLLRKNLLNLVDRDFTQLVKDVIDNLSDPFTQKVIQEFKNNLKK